MGGIPRRQGETILQNEKNAPEEQSDASFSAKWLNR